MEQASGKQSVLIVIVTYNAMKWIDKCFGSIEASTVEADVFIVDNGSLDGTQDYIRKNYPKFLFRESGKNLGFGRANNVGLQYALERDYDYVYLLNQDAWLYPDTLETLIQTHREHPEFGIISPIQIQANGKHLDYSFLDATIKTPQYVDDLYSGRRGLLYHQRLVMAAHWLISRECLRKVGGFSPTFPHYGEDNNYASRSVFHVGFTDKTKAVHDREHRVDGKDKLLYYFYIGLLVNFSDMNIPKYKLVLPNLWEMIKLTIKFCSLKPLGYLLRFLSEVFTIRKNYKLSKFADCAFLND